MPKLAADAALAAAVDERLAMGWSPHAVAADLRAGGGPAVCAETIYRACYDPAGARGLPGGGSWKKLPRRCRRRKPRGRPARKPSPLGDYRPIADRPAAAGDRSEAGHWEGDLIIGKDNRSAAATLVERVSRRTLAVPLPDGYDADSAAAAVAGALARQPRRLLKTLTWDQGREMARWADIEAALGIKVYFCEPRSPWQRPTNEQTNGLLRRWLPQSTDLNVGAVRLAIIEDHLNTMPQSWQEHWPLGSVSDRFRAELERERLLHSLGNLTLVNGKLNPKLSNAPWASKREALAKHTVLHLNKELVDAYKDRDWTDATIRERGSELAKVVRRIWPAPLA